MLAISVWSIKSHESATREWYFRYNIGHIISHQIELIDSGRGPELTMILKRFSDRAPEWASLSDLLDELIVASRASNGKTEQDADDQLPARIESKAE